MHIMYINTYVFVFLQYIRNVKSIVVKMEAHVANWQCLIYVTAQMIIQEVYVKPLVRFAMCICIACISTYVHNCIYKNVTN